ncbi:MAG: BRCT domain-containing protein [bacterium]
MQVTEFLSKLKRLNNQELLEVKGLGPILVKNLMEFMNSTRFTKMYTKFENLESQNKGLQIIHKKIDTSSLPLDGQVICITGTFDKSRHQIKEILENKGAKVVDSVTSATTTLLTGDNAGSKLEKAKKLNIKIVNDYLQLLEL